MNNNENKNESNNRRIVIGATIFAVLIALNLLVRYSRSSRTSPVTPATPTVTAIPYPVSVPVTAPATASPTSLPGISQPIASSAIDISDSLIPGSEQQMLALNSKLDALKQELQAIDKPFAPPDMRIDLQLADFDRFRWQMPLIAATETIFIATEPVIASVAKTVEILGIFKVSGRNKLMIREDNKVFLVSENEEPLADSISVEKIATDSYLVFDRDGSSHDLQLKQPQENGVEKAINILKGKREHQPSFDMQMGVPATGSELLPNTDGR